MRNWLSILVLVMVAALVLPAVAEAKTFTGVGALRAVGRGTVGLHGRGEAEYRLHGVGKLVVGNRLATKINATGVGKREVVGDKVIFTGHKGIVTVEGSKLATYFAGGAVNFRCRGRGRVTLHGTGKFWVNGVGPKGWKVDEAESIALGTPDADDAEVVEVDEYEAETAVVVADIQKFDSFKEWAEAHPAAAAALLRAKNFHEWAKAHPKAAAWLYKHPHWKAHLAKHPRLATFIHNHHAFVKWCNAHPGYAHLFRHHAAYGAWLKNHPKAAAAIKKGTPYAVWAKNHPSAATALHKQRVYVKKKLDLNKDGKVDAKEAHLGVKRRVDANKDGKIQPVEAKRAQQKRVEWKKRADLNEDHRVDKKERAVDALRRQRRRNNP